MFEGATEELRLLLPRNLTAAPAVTSAAPGRHTAAVMELGPPMGAISE